MDPSGPFFYAKMKIKNLRTPLIFEILTWGVPSSVFILIYCLKFSAKATVAPAYALNIISLWMGMSALRITFWLFTWPRENTKSKQAIDRVSKFTASLLITLPLTTIYIWQTLLVASLLAWNRIITWDMAIPYIKNFSATKDLLEIPIWPLYILPTTFIAIQLLIYKKIQKIDISLKVQKAPLIKKVFLIITFTAIFLTQTSRLINQEQTHPQEPLELSIFGTSSSQLQSHEIKENPILEQAEEESRTSYQKSSNFENRNIILFIGDALRSDHMGIYGYRRNTTPKLLEASKKHQTLIVKGMRSTCAESTCGILSIISSRPLRFTPRTPITIHQALHINGYRTILILSGDHTNFYGLKKLYGPVDEYYDATSTIRYTNDDKAVIERARQLPDFDENRPVIIHFHLMSAHGLGVRTQEKIQYQPSSSYYKWSSYTQRSTPTKEEIEEAQNYYDNGVLQLDDTISELTAILKEKGYLKNAVVAITGDHGEMLGEHSHFGHQRTVEEGVLTIPFIIQRYGYKDRAFGNWQTTSQTDIAPTLLEELKLSSPSVWQGTALQKTAAPRITYFQQESQSGIYWNLTGDTIKYWKNEKTQEEFSYKIDNDKEEKENLIESTPTYLLDKWRHENLKNQVR